MTSTGSRPQTTRTGPETGQSLAEYALIVALIVIFALAALTFFGTQIGDILSLIAERIQE
ncbi:MAG TPA: Flp family type IVb pilin [Candidatus Limnocylindria bacterium]|nr:Flp family type IVb pilin [Candidatus Limnocylindria bacterium]